MDNYKNERFLWLGMPSLNISLLALKSPLPGDNVSDLDYSDAGSTTSASESGSEDDDSDTGMNLAPPSDSSLPPLDIPRSSPLAESEFRTEVRQSLERAFTEGHSVDNAAVELKTLRMASNVPLTRVREAVVAAIVEHIRLVEGGGAAQRKEIASVISRWGRLIDKIGGVDEVETISALQVMYDYMKNESLTCEP